MIYHVYANQSNVGDWLSARGIQRLLAPHQVHELFCDGPFVPLTLAVLSKAGPDDLIIIGGGGLFMDYFASFWVGFREIAARVPFVVWGAGACETKLQRSRVPEALVREIARQSRLCVVRDELTRDMLDVPGSPDPVICPAVAVVDDAPLTGRAVLHADHYDNVGPENFEVMAAATSAYAARTGRRSSRTNNIIPRGNASALQAVLDLYLDAELVVSSRLHGCIIALAMGRRVVVVSGDHKVEAFMHAAGMAEWVLDLAHVRALPERLEALPGQQLPVAFMEQGRRRNREIAAEIRAMLVPERTSMVG